MGIRFNLLPRASRTRLIPASRVMDIVARRHVPPLAIASAAVAVFSLTPSVSQAPLVLLLSTVLLQSSINPSAWLQNLASYTLTLGLASTLARLAPSLTALSTPGISILILFFGSLISTFSTLLPIILYAAIAPSLSPIPHAFLFPALWTTWLVVASHSSPFGRLAAWSPVLGGNAYRWMVPYLGAPGQDWVIACFAIVLANLLQQTGWDFQLGYDSRGHLDNFGKHDPVSPLIDVSGDHDDRRRPLPQHDLLDDLRRPVSSINEAIDPIDSGGLVDTQRIPSSSTLPEYPSRAHPSSSSSRSADTRRATTIATLSLVLAALALPSRFLSPGAPGSSLPHTSFPSPYTTDVSLACILPPPTNPLSSDPKSSFEAYLAESRVLGSLARIHLWPESAVQFENSKDRAEGVEAVRAVAAQYGIWIGVGFEDPVPHADRHDGKGKRRNGVMLVDSDGIVMEHYKNHIVPVTESFSITPSTEPPTVHTIQIPYGFRQGRKQHYAKRPLSLTASICLDFAHPGGLLTLGERPDLILAPASTWDASIGEGMVQQARMRADEVGATLLWCDGGGSAGEGVSAVVGRGETGESVGRSSFVRTIGVPWLGGDEGDDRVVTGRTLYARSGDALALSLVWGLVLGAWGAGRFADTFGRQGHRATKNVMVRFNQRIRDGISWVRGRVRSARERRAVVSVQEPSLIDVA